MDRSLHPNLARIAAAHDEIIAAHQRGQITPPEARRRVLSLVARDDAGLEWSIDPDSGMWRYRSHWGELTTADPPAYGVVGLTPEAIGASAGPAQDERVSFYEVDEDALHAPGQLRGSTVLGNDTSSHKRNTVRLASAIAGVAAVVVVVLQFL